MITQLVLEALACLTLLEPRIRLASSFMYAYKFCKGHVGNLCMLHKHKSRCRACAYLRVNQVVDAHWRKVAHIYKQMDPLSVGLCFGFGKDAASIIPLMKVGATALGSATRLSRHTRRSTVGVGSPNVHDKEIHMGCSGAGMLLDS